MILSFKKQFVEKIISGSKIHTIRKDPHARWKAGRKIHMATGVRTKNYKCFKEDDCDSIESFDISYIGNLCVRINGIVRFIKKENNLYDTEFIMMLTKNDGFDSPEDFLKYFHSNFHGVIVHWTNFRY